MTTLYLELGGISAMKKAARALLGLLCNDGDLGNQAIAHDADELLPHLEAFLTFTFGGSPYYEGSSLRTDFDRLLSTDSQFDRFCTLVGDALDVIHASDVHREEAVMVAEQMRDFVLNRPVAQSA